jgi:excisionase family DNA binding protein
MSELRTSKQLQNLLQIDRVTVYRMLNDGRLKGVKIGNQWRFPQSEIDRLLGEEPEASTGNNGFEAITDFPSDCVQNVQEIFAGIIGIGAITVSMHGDVLTRPTFSNPFCKLILSSEKGRTACQASWRRIAHRATGAPPFQICHAGLSYIRSEILMDDKPAAWLIAGQYYLSSPDRKNENERMEILANKFDLPQESLVEAARKIPILKNSQVEKVREWTPKVAGTVNSILCERSDLMSRLQRIAELSTVIPKISTQSEK